MFLPRGTIVGKPTLPHRIWNDDCPSMQDPDKLRDRAARLRALAIKAREEGKPLLADEITRLVSEISEQADEVERQKRQRGR